MKIISNVRHDWESLTFVPQRRDPRQPKRIRPISAVDTETIDGRMWLIADSLGRHSFPSTWGKLLQWLEAGELFQHTLFCWNLDYDARAMLGLLDENTLLELAVTNRFTSAEFSLVYVPHKFLVISYRKHRYEFFDLMQFFASSLNGAAKQYLGVEKLDVDARRLSTDAQYRADNLDLIIQYCKRDAELTADLGRLNYQLYEGLGVRSNKWYSTGYIAGRYFITHGGVPRYHAKEPQRYAYYSYAGGRFECFKRGYFEDAYKYDITSAYPFVISGLPDLDNGRWERSPVIDYDADLIFARCRVTMPDQHIQPLHVKYHGLVVYPTIGPHYRILTKSELELIDEYDLATVEVYEGWHFYANTRKSPFESINDMFAERQHLKIIKDPRQLVLKVVMNSLYGKFIQITTEVVPELLRKVGPLFVPAYASEITARTRMQVLRTTLERDMSPIAFFTDAILTEDRESLDSEGLGNWNLETSGELLLLGCGVYSFRGDTKTDTHIRGFSNSINKDLFEMVEHYGNKSHIPFRTERPISLGEYISRNLSKSGHHLNEWIERLKILDINFDQKRVWEKEFSRCSDILHGSHLSVPLKVNI